MTDATVDLPPPAAKSTALPAVRFVIAGHGRALIRMTATAFFGGLAEALLLITVTRAAFAITGGKEHVGILAGWFVSVNQMLVLALGLVVVRIALAGWAGAESARLSSTVVARIRHRLALAFLDSSWEVQQAQQAGSLQELLSGYSGKATGMMASVNQTILSAANLVALLGMAVAVDPVGAIVLVVPVGVLGTLLRPLRSVVRRRARAASQVGMQLATSVNEVSELGMELHVFHVQAAAGERVGALIERARQSSRRLMLAAGLVTPIYIGLAYLALLSALAVVAASDVTSLTSLGAAMLVMMRSLSYGQALQGAYTNVSASAPPIDELQRRLGIFEKGKRGDGGEPVGHVGQLTVRDVTFAYIPGQPVLRHVSFTIEKSEIIGVVGPSGGGKSTLVQLLLGLRDPSEGTILADGRDIAEFAKAEWVRKVTFVPQAARLIAGSVADNIRFLREDVSDTDVERAARLAHLHEDLAGFPEGYDREVGNHGGRLSGGQQQRLCIARALVGQPDVLILDEPTSALDARSEHLIRETLVGLKESSTIIVIAHRLSTLDICDRIMVIQDGVVRGFDTPYRLEQSSDFYREALILSGLR